MKAARPAYVIHLMMSASWQTLVWDEIHLGRMVGPHFASKGAHAHQTK